MLLKISTEESAEEAKISPEEIAEVIKILDTGFWYANDYFSFLVKLIKISGNASGKKRLDYFLKKDCFRLGYADPQSGLFLRAEGESAFKYDLFPLGSRKRKPPSVVVRNFGENLIFVDCTMALHLAYYRVILGVLGEERFNEVFGQVDEVQFLSLKRTKLTELLTNIPDPDSGAVRSEVDIGTHFYFLNHGLYLKKDVVGEAQAYNAVLSGYDLHGNPLFIGFGLHPDGETVQSISGKLVAAFNQDPYNERLMTPDRWPQIAPQGLSLELYNALKHETITSMDDFAIYERVASQCRGFGGGGKFLRDLVENGRRKSGPRRFLNFELVLSLRTHALQSF